MSTLDTVINSTYALMQHYSKLDVAETATRASSNLATVKTVIARSALSEKTYSEAIHAQAIAEALYGQALGDSGNFRLAIEALNGALINAGRVRNAKLVTYIHCLLARIALDRGHPGLALSYLNRLSTPGQQATRSLVLTAKAYAALGDRTQANSAILMANGIAEDGELAVFEAEPFTGLSRAELAIGTMDVLTEIDQFGSALKIATTWHTLQTRAPFGIKAHLDASTALAMAHVDPNAGAKMMMSFISTVSKVGDLTPTSAGKVDRLLAQNDIRFSEVRALEEMKRSLIGNPKRS